jgi:hypothetical protein
MRGLVVEGYRRVVARLGAYSVRILREKREGPTVSLRAMTRHYAQERSV